MDMACMKFYEVATAFEVELFEICGMKEGRKGYIHDLALFILADERHFGQRQDFVYVEVSNSNTS